MRKFLVSFVFIGLALVSLTGCEKYALDRQMEELCKKDGGVEVYETVALPISEFNSLYAAFMARGKYNNPNSENPLGPDYRYIESWETIKAGDPIKGGGRLRKYTEKIYRNLDGKLLGISVQYGRAGGDLVVLGHWSTAACPVVMQSIFRSIFIKGNEK